MVAKVQWLFFERCTTIGLRISGHRAAGIFTKFLRKSTKDLGSIRGVQCTKATQRHANIREIKVRRSETFKSKFLISAVRTLKNVNRLRSTLRASANEELGTLADNTPLTNYEPEIFDDHHISPFPNIILPWTYLHTSKKKSGERNGPYEDPWPATRLLHVGRPAACVS